MCNLAQEVIMKKDFVTADLTHGQTNALVKIIMKQMGIDDVHEAYRRIVQNEWYTIERFLDWREKDGVVYFSVTSSGTTGPEWVKKIENRGSNFNVSIKKFLLSSDFKPTYGQQTGVGILRNDVIDPELITADSICTAGRNRGLWSPRPELALLIWEALLIRDFEAMKLSSVLVMHEPQVKAFGSNSKGFLCPHRWDPIGLSLDVDNISQLGNAGFAFYAPTFPDGLF